MPQAKTTTQKASTSTKKIATMKAKTRKVSPSIEEQLKAEKAKNAKLAKKNEQLEQQLDIQRTLLNNPSKAQNTRLYIEQSEPDTFKFFTLHRDSSKEWYRVCYTMHDNELKTSNKGYQFYQAYIVRDIEPLKSSDSVKPEEDTAIPS